MAATLPASSATRSSPPPPASTCSAAVVPRAARAPSSRRSAARSTTCWPTPGRSACFEHGSRPWGDWLRFWRERDQLAARVDLDDRTPLGRRRPFVRIVTDLDRLPEHLGVRRLPPVQVPGADQAELARRISAVVGIRVPVASGPR